MLHLAKINRIRIAALLALSLLTTVAFAAVAVTYSVPWYSVDGGGGTSQGGTYALTGTIGQSDAGNMSGGAYTLQGGFIQPDSTWPYNAAQSPWWIY